MDAQFNVNKNSKTITIRPKPATTVRKESQPVPVKDGLSKSQEFRLIQIHLFRVRLFVS